MRFPDENNCKTDLKCHPSWLVDKENFSLKIAYSNISFTCLSYWITLDLHLILEDHSPNPSPISKMAVIGGSEIFTRNGGKARNEGGWFCNNWFYEDPLYCLPPPFFKFCPPPPPFTTLNDWMNNSLISKI